MITSNISIVTAIPVSSGCEGAPQTKVINEVTYDLIWCDEFNPINGQNILDTNKWYVYDCKHPNYDGCLRDDNVYVADGKLVLRASKNPSGNFTCSPCYTGYPSGSQPWAGAEISTKGKFQFKYGYLEASIKVSKGMGLWGSMWLVRGLNTTTKYREIDVPEHLGKNPSNLIFANHYGCPNPPPNANWCSVGKIYTGVDWSLNFHKYALLWTPTFQVYYVDDIEVWRNTTNIQDEEMLIILDHAAGGGTYAGIPDNTTIFPAYWLIDYVRVYQKT